VTAGPRTIDLRERLLVSFGGAALDAAAAEAIAARAAGVTLYRHLNVQGAPEVRALTDALQAAAARLHRPTMLVGADHETGQLHALAEDATPFPGAMALGAVGDEGLTERVGVAIGTELRALGVNVAYAPVCDLATNPGNPVVGIRSFGADPVAVGRHAASMVRGLQSAGVAATAKHFPGHGDPGSDSHHGLPVIERTADELRERELEPFAAAIDAGARLTMAGHLAVPAVTGRRDVAATLSPQLLRTLLRGDLGFGGVTVSDALDMGGIAGGDGTGVDVATVLDAGTDLLLCGPDQAARVRVEVALDAAIAAGRGRSRDAEAAIARINDLRAWLAGFGTPPLSVVGSAPHRVLASEVARRSVTLIRDRAGLVPLRLARDAAVLVVEPRPRNLTPADTTSWLPAGGVAEALRPRWPALVGRVVDAVVPPHEIAALVAAAADADLVILGTVDAAGEPSTVELARALLGGGRPVVAVALRAPWDADAYPEVGTVIATYGIQSPSLAALAEALNGAAPITGRAPVPLRSA
jgi:beta-N-acetylhexosaminidase